MTDQTLPDDLLNFIVAEYLNPSTGRNDRECLEAVKNVSLASKALALASRRFIFERTKIIVGGSTDGVDSSAECAVEGLQRLFAANPTYFGFVKSLRVESRLMVCPTGKEAPMDGDPGDSVEDDYAYLDLEEQEGSISICYTSSGSEEAATCWLLSQKFPNLVSFHFIIRPIHTDRQLRLRTGAFHVPALISSPASWSYNSLGSRDKTIATCLPEAVVRFLGAEDQPMERLTLSSNLPPRILQYFNKPKPLKYLFLPKFSEVMPLLRTQVEVPFFLGMDGASLAVLEYKVEVEELACDGTGGGMVHWVKGPDCYIDLGRLKALRLNTSWETLAQTTVRFPFQRCSESLSTLKLLHPDSSLAWDNLTSLGSVRKLTLGYNLQDSNSPRCFNQIRYSLDRVKSAAIEVAEIGFRVTDPTDFALIQVLTTLDRYFSPRITTEWLRLKTLRIVVCLSDEEWRRRVQEKEGFAGLKLRVRASFGPLLNAPPELSKVAQPVLEVDVEKDSESSLWSMEAR